MPYQYPRNIPKQIEKLPKVAQKKWVEIFNAVEKEANDEDKARQAAWAWVKRHYKKKGDKWVSKSHIADMLSNFDFDKELDLIVTDVRDEQLTKGIENVMEKLPFTGGNNLIDSQRKILKSFDLEKSITHNSKTEKNEPKWADVGKKKLPRMAHADIGKPEDKSTWQLPHHWVKDGQVGNMNVYSTGTMLLHRGGLIAAWAATKKKQISDDLKNHLNAHRAEIGLTKKELDQLAELYIKNNEE